MSTPRTWSSGEDLESQWFNQEIRDQWNNAAFTGSDYEWGADIAVSGTDTVLNVFAASLVIGKRYIIQASGAASTSQTASSAIVYLRHRTAAWAVNDTSMTGATTMRTRLVQYGTTATATQYHIMTDYTATATETRYFSLVGNRNGGTGIITFYGNTNNDRALMMFPIGP